MARKIALIRTPHSDVEVFRARVRTLGDALAEIEAAPPSPSEISERLTQLVAVEELIARDRHNPALLLSDGPVSNLDDVFSASTVGGLALVFGADAVVKALIREATAEATALGLPAMSDAEKVAERERIERDVFEAEVGEELACRSCEAVGLDIPRRRDIRNTAVLVATTESLEA